MPKFQIAISKTYIVGCEVEIEADDEDAAVEKGEELLEKAKEDQLYVVTPEFARTYIRETEMVDYIKKHPNYASEYPQREYVPVVDLGLPHRWWVEEEFEQVAPVAPLEEEESDQEEEE